METDADVTGPAARAALAQVDAGRSAAARRVGTPWWFHPLLGAALAVSLAALSLRGPAVAVVLVLSVAAQGALYALYQRLTGLWVNTWHVDGMRKVTAIVTTITLLVLAIGVGLDRGAGLRGAAAITGAVLGVAYVVYWRWVERRLVSLWSAEQ